MDDSQMEALLGPYNPWWQAVTEWEGLLPDFERPVVGQILADLDELPQMVSVTGPRRVGKSTAVRQVVRRLIRQKGILPERIVYFSLDDPEIAASRRNQQVIIDLLVRRMQTVTPPPAYMFLDEVQRLPRWELFLKKYYEDNVLFLPLRYFLLAT